MPRPKDESAGIAAPPQAPAPSMSSAGFSSSTALCFHIDLLERASGGKYSLGGKGRGKVDPYSELDSHFRLVEGPRTRRGNIIGRPQRVGLRGPFHSYWSAGQPARDHSHEHP